MRWASGVWRPSRSPMNRSEERRVGKECRSRWSADDLKKKGDERRRGARHGSIPLHVLRDATRVAGGEETAPAQAREGRGVVQDLGRAEDGGLRRANVVEH